MTGTTQRRRRWRQITRFAPAKKTLSNDSSVTSPEQSPGSPIKVNLLEELTHYQQLYQNTVNSRPPEPRSSRVNSYFRYETSPRNSTVCPPPGVLQSRTSTSTNAHIAINEESAPSNLRTSKSVTFNPKVEFKVKYSYFVVTTRDAYFGVVPRFWLWFVYLPQISCMICSYDPTAAL